MSVPTRARGLLALGLVLALGGSLSAQEYSTYAPRSGPSIMPAPPVSAPEGSVVTVPVARPPARIAARPARLPAPVTPMPPAPVRYKTSYQPPAVPIAPGLPQPAQTDINVQLEPPGLERLARIDTDPQLQERIRQETKDIDPSEAVTFPEGPILSREEYRGRVGLWPKRKLRVEPYFVCYGKGQELFQQNNFERYGWDLGIVTPLLCVGTFIFDTAAAPYRYFREPCRFFDCGTGYCLPGDPVPFLLYPPHLSVPGTLAEAAAIATLIVLFP